MYKNNIDSKRIKIAAASLCTVAVALIIFTVMVYNDKRSASDEFNDFFDDTTNSQYDNVTLSDISTSSQDEMSSEETDSGEASSDNEAVSSDASDDSVENDILNPDNKSEYYIVVYTGNQRIVVYQKDKNGKYSHKFHLMTCSTGADETPTKEGVYSIQKKEKWAVIGTKEYAQYGCLISEENNYYICSISYSKKNAWTLKSGVYDNIGKAVTGGSIQLCTRDAYWIYDNMPTGTQINVVNRDGPDDKIKDLPKSVKKNAGWDPTDKWSKGNPYFTTTTKASTTPTTAQSQDENPVG